MTFNQWWYDYCVKNGKRGKAEDIARAAWAQAAIGASKARGGVSVKDKANQALAAIWLVDTLLAEAGYSADSSARNNLAAAKSLLMELES